MNKNEIDIPKLVEEFLETEIIDIKVFLEKKRIVYDELLLEKIIDELSKRLSEEWKKDR